MSHSRKMFDSYRSTSCFRTDLPALVPIWPMAQASPTVPLPPNVVNIVALLADLAHPSANLGHPTYDRIRPTRMQQFGSHSDYLG